MADSTSQSELIQGCLDRLRSGDAAARDELLRHAYGRLQRLARKLLQGYPGVRRWDQTDDVLQNSLLRLLRTLQTIRPETPRDFFNLAAVHIRRELLDLARRAKGKGTVPLDPAGSSDPRAPEPAAPASADADTDRWVRFHEAVDALPVEEREVVGLVFYHGWTQAQIAELFQVDERTVRRRWASACKKIREMCGVDLDDS